MAISTAELVEQLADARKSNAAREELVKLGEASVAALLNAAGEPRDIQHYKTILRTLLTIKDPISGQLFRRAVDSDDEEIRSIGARGLHLLKAPDALRWLQVTINDAPDPLHFDHTPAVQSLIELGMDALPAVFALMESADKHARRRAQFVLASVVLRDINQHLHPRPLTSDAQAAWEDLRKANGSYQWDGPEPARKASIERWKEWLSSRRSPPDYAPRR